jgi:hypothetical protein
MPRANVALAISDPGVTCNGTFAPGILVAIDGVERRASMGGMDVTPYSSGLFPLAEPGGTTLTYTDDPTSSHLAAITVRYRDRWW